MKRIAILAVLLVAARCASAQTYGRLDFRLQSAQGQAISGGTVNVYLQPAAVTSATVQTVQVVAVTPFAGAPLLYYALVTFTANTPPYSAGQTYAFSGLTNYTALNGQNLYALQSSTRNTTSPVFPAANQALFLFGSATYSATSDTGSASVVNSSTCGSAANVSTAGLAPLFSTANGTSLKQPVVLNGHGEGFAYVAQGCYTIAYNSPYTGTLSYADQNALPAAQISTGGAAQGTQYAVQFNNNGAFGGSAATVDNAGNGIFNTLRVGPVPVGHKFTLNNLATVPADWTMDTTTQTTAIQSMVPALAPNSGGGVNGNGVPIFPFAALNVQASPAQYATNHSITWSAHHAFGDSITCTNLGLTPLCLTLGGQPATGADAPAGQGYTDLVAASLGVTLSNYGKPGGTACDINAQIAEYENPVAGDNVFRTVSALANDMTKGNRRYEQTAAQCHFSMLAWLSTYSANKCGASTFGGTCMGNAPGALPAGWQSESVAVSQVVSDGATCTVTTSANMIAAGEPQILGGFTAGNAVLNGVYGKVSATGLSTTNYQMPCTVAAATYAGAGTTKTFGQTDLVTANTNAAAITFPVNTTAVNGGGNTDQTLYLVYEIADWDGALIKVQDVKGGNSYKVKAFFDYPINGNLTGQGWPGGGNTALGVFRIPYNPNSPTQQRVACNFGTDANCKIVVTVESLSGVQNKAAVMLMIGPHLHTGPPIWLAGPTHEVFKINQQQQGDYQQIAENNAYFLQNQGANVYWHPMDKFFFGTTVGTTPEMSDGTGTVASCNPTTDTAGYTKHPCQTGHAAMAAALLGPSTQPQYRDTPFANIQSAYNNPLFSVIIPQHLQDAISQLPAQAASVLTLGCDGTLTADGSTLNSKGYSIPIVSASNTTVNLPNCGGPIEFRFPPLTLAGVVTFVPAITGADGFFKLHQYQGAICDNNNVIANGVYQWTCWPSNGAAGIETDGNPYKIQIDTVTSNAAVRIVAPNVTVGGNTTFSVFNPDSTVGYLRYVYAASAANDSWCFDFSNATAAAFCAFPDGHVNLGGPLNLNGTTSPLSLNGAAGTSGKVLTSAGAGATPTWTTPTSGSVTSVAMTGDGTIFNSTVAGSPVTTSGTLAPALLTQTANTVLAGPTTGAASAPTFRALVAADLPATATGRVVSGYSPGTATSSATLTLGGLGGSFGGFTGTPTASIGWIAPVSVTLSNLSVRCATHAFAAADGKFTIFTSTSPAGAFTTSTMTVTYDSSVTNGTTIVDNTHTVNVAAGSLVVLEVASGVTQTLANCSASFNY